ncbi:hypothetical protein F2Q69_00007455 [Brassica cretica]|uniref:Retrotransposon gag domain-containing protein n=1 Tax=Brassica cretica TaxID=69181 RepID=A0A8S9P6T4_BRACR|nr:hypothetical protein F2Q69_00007455 [Brassica cretica]
MIMAVDELPKAIQREAELQRQIDRLQSQATELHKTREEANPELSSEFQSQKEKLNEHSKQREQSTEKLSQLESENLNLRDENQALNTASNKKRRFRAQVRPMPALETPNSGTGVNLPPTASGGDASTREKAKDAQTYDVEDSESELEPDKESLDREMKVESPMVAYLEHMFSKRLDAMQSMVERLPGISPPIRKSNPESYAETPFTDEITLIEMPRKFSFPITKVYDGTTDQDDHVAQYRQRMLVVALPKDSCEATMCKGFGSNLTGPALQWYINLPSMSIASFAILSDKFVEQFASSRNLEKTSDGLYEILQHRAEPLRGYIARFNQEKVVIPECSIPTAIAAFKRGLIPDGDLFKDCAKAQQKQDPKTIRPDRTERDEKPSQRPARDSGKRNRGRYQNQPIEKAEGMAVSTWPDISHLSVSRSELINVQRKMGQQVKWPQKMKAPDSFWNPGFWTPQGVPSKKAKSHLSKETTGKPTAAAPLSPPRQDRVIHVISGGSDISGISHAAAKKITWNAKHGLEAGRPKCMLLANCLMKRILVDNRSSGNIIFQAAYKDLGLEESALTRRITPLIGFSGEVKQTAGEG